MLEARESDKKIENAAWKLAEHIHGLNMEMPKMISPVMRSGRDGIPAMEHEIKQKLAVNMVVESFLPGIINGLSEMNQNMLHYGPNGEVDTIDEVSETMKLTGKALMNIGMFLNACSEDYTLEWFVGAGTKQWPFKDGSDPSDIFFHSLVDSVVAESSAIAAAESMEEDSNVDEEDSNEDVVVHPVAIKEEPLDEDYPVRTRAMSIEF